MTNMNLYGCYTECPYKLPVYNDQILMVPKVVIIYWFDCSKLAHNNKLILLEACNTIHEYDILYISETYLDSSVSVDDTTPSLPGYNLI